MWYSATVHAYDVLGRVQIVVRVFGDGGDGEEQMVEQLSCATTIDGVGEPEAREWLRDALVAAIEAV